MEQDAVRYTSSINFYVDKKHTHPEKLICCRKRIQLGASRPTHVNTVYWATETIEAYVDLPFIAARFLVKKAVRLAELSHSPSVSSPCVARCLRRACQQCPAAPGPPVVSPPAADSSLIGRFAESQFRRRNCSLPTRQRSGVSRFNLHRFCCSLQLAKLVSRDCYRIISE